jgi:hypothetical protein
MGERVAPCEIAREKEGGREAGRKRGPFELDLLLHTSRGGGEGKGGSQGGKWREGGGGAGALRWLDLLLASLSPTLSSICLANSSGRYSCRRTRVRCVCVCVRACVHVHVRVCVRARACTGSALGEKLAKYTQRETGL